jgi:Skp family chaperone for outer membrane proteins
MKTIMEVSKTVSHSAKALSGVKVPFILQSCSTLLRSSVCAILFFAIFACQVHAKSKQAQDYGGGLSVSIPASETEVLQAVQDVVADGIIQGSKEYNKDEYISGAESVSATGVFSKWTGSGQVFYKIKKNALDPRNFKDSGDSGVLAVRYIVQSGDAKSTLLKIEAIFVDDNHHGQHLSNGSVEGAEYKDIQDHIAAMQLKKTEATQEEQRHQQQLAAQELEQKRKQQQLEKVIARGPDETLQQHVNRLRHDVERLVKSPGSQLKSAPFKSASSLQSLPAGTHVAILISTPYWYGVETEDGQHGWIHRSQLEQLP